MKLLKYLTWSTLSFRVLENNSLLLLNKCSVRGFQTLDYKPKNNRETDGFYGYNPKN